MMKMNWNYIAGFFDGEGCLSMVRRKGRKDACRIQIIQKDKMVLEIIQQFLQSNNIKAYIYKRKPGKTQFSESETFSLQIARRRSVKYFLDNIKGKIIVKADVLNKMLNLDYSFRYCKT